MYKSKNCGHGFDLYVKVKQYGKRMSAPLTRKEELIEALEELTGDGYIEFTPAYCPICGEKVEI